MFVKSPCDFWPSTCSLSSTVVQSPLPDYHNNSCGYRTAIVEYLYDATYGASTGYGLTFLFSFFQKCKSAEYYKIVEAMETVGSRRIVVTS